MNLTLVIFDLHLTLFRLIRSFIHGLITRHSIGFLRNRNRSDVRALIAPFRDKLKTKKHKTFLIVCVPQFSCPFPSFVLFDRRVLVIISSFLFARRIGSERRRTNYQIYFDDFKRDISSFSSLLKCRRSTQTRDSRIPFVSFPPLVLRLHSSAFSSLLSGRER